MVKLQKENTILEILSTLIIKDATELISLHQRKVKAHLKEKKNFKKNMNKGEVYDKKFKISLVYTDYYSINN